MLPSWFLHDTVKTSIPNCNFPPFSRSVRNREKQYYEKLSTNMNLFEIGGKHKNKKPRSVILAQFIYPVYLFFLCIWDYTRLENLEKTIKFIVPHQFNYFYIEIKNK